MAGSPGVEGDCDNGISYAERLRFCFPSGRTTDGTARDPAAPPGRPLGGRWAFDEDKLEFDSLEEAFVFRQKHFADVSFLLFSLV